MQFLVYIVVLMVSASTILLELHWLTSPSPQPKPAVQASASPPPAPRKIEGPSAELSPVYPKPETPQGRAAEEAGTPSEPASPAATAKAEPVAPAPVAPAAPVSAAAKTEPASEPPQTTSTTKVETTGTAMPVETAQPALSSATFTPATQTPTATRAGATTKNKCDVSSCAAAYASFQASDCTYQPFEGPRQVCVKPPAAAAKTAAAPRAPNVDMRKRPRDEELRDVGRDVRRVTPSMADIDDDDVIVIRRPRW